MWPEHPRCPNCQQAIDLQPLFKVVGRNRGGRLRQPAGLRCASCRAKLRVVQPRIAFINAAVFLLMLVCMVGLGLEAQSSGRHHLAPLSQLMLIVIFGSYYAMEPKYAARSAKLEKVDENHALYMPFEPQEETEELSDSELLDAVIDNAAHTPRSGPVSPEWTCANCGQSNPGDFDLCWSCQKTRQPESTSS